MPRLSNLPSRTATLPRRFADKDRQERIRNAARTDNAPWRKWYGQARWKRLRLRIIERDDWTCQRTGAPLTGKHPDPDSPVVDHIIPHEGDERLFWDETNLQSVTKAYHDSVKKAREYADRNAAIRPDWLPAPICPVTMVCGPPASGKTRYVRNHAAPNDQILDLDDIAAEVSGQSGHEWDRARWLGPALHLRNTRLAALGHNRPKGRAWFILTEPTADGREWWQRKLAADVVVIATPLALCRERASLDSDRDVGRTADAASQWWHSYTARPDELVIRT